MPTVNKDNFKARPVTVGLMLWFFGGLSTVVVAVGGWILADLKSDMAAESASRKEWVKEEFKPHVTKFDDHVTEFHKTAKDVGVVLDRTKGAVTEPATTHNLESVRPED